MQNSPGKQHRSYIEKKGEPKRQKLKSIGAPIENCTGALNEAKAKMDKLNRQETRKSLLPVKLCAI